MKRKSKSKTAIPQTRVAIYTRQSVANDLEFGSIDAQREAAEAYVTSKRSAGWVALPDRYDDHGYSGGNTERPAFKRLVQDVEAGKVDAITTYKLDRISRSFPDFTAFMARLDKLGVAFCSVTEGFDTETHTGKLMMNMIASFGEFERATIAERTRDKIIATRRKGLWTGGRPVLGYDVKDKALVVNKTEVDTVRTVFHLYLEHGGLVATVAELERRGIRNKSWVTKAGRRVHGAPFNNSTLRHLLTNQLYIGKIRCGDEQVDGRHEAIIDARLFDEVACTLREHRRQTRKPEKWGAILRGILRCGRCGAAMSHAANRRGHRTHRYYVCQTIVKEGAAKCPRSRAPAPGIEEVVTSKIRGIGTDPSVLVPTLKAAKQARAAKEPELIAESRRIANERTLLASERKNLLDALQQGGVAANTIAGRLAEVDERIAKLEARNTEAGEQLAAIANDIVDEDELRDALRQFTPVWDELIPKERARLLRLLIKEVRYDGQEGEVEIKFRELGIKGLTEEIGGRRSA